MKYSNYSYRIFRGYRIVFLWVFVIIFVVITIALSLIYELNRIDNKFQYRGGEIHRNLAQRVASLETVLTSLVGFYHAKEFLSIAEKTSFSQDMLRAYPFITSIMHMPRISEDSREEFEADMREQGFVSFKMKVRADQAGKWMQLNKYHMPVSFIEPMDPLSARMLGYDLTQSKVNHQLLQDSIQSGVVTTVGPVQTDYLRYPLYFIIKPVYQGRYPPENAQERSSMFNGMAALAIEPKRLIAGLISDDDNLQISLNRSVKEYQESQKQSVGYSILNYTNKIDLYGASFILSIDQRLTYEDINWGKLLAIWLLAISTLIMSISVYRNKRKALLQEEEADAAIAAEDARFSHVIHTAFDAVITADENNIILSWNRQAAAVFGYSEHEVLGEDLFKLILTSGSLRKSSQALKELIQGSDAYPKGIRLELEGKDKNNRVFPLDLAISCSRIGDLFTISVFARDITESKKWDEKIHSLAYSDPLTKLPNRQAFKERVVQAINLARQQNHIGAVLYLDLDEFKRINDILGHDIGDMLLTHVTRRLESHIRSSDLVCLNSEEKWKIARLGGDEFTLLLEDIQNPEVAGDIAKRVKDAIAGSYNLGGHEVYVTPSIGIAIFPQDGSSVDELLKNADTAMYYAKSVGKNNCQFYSEQMNAKAASRLKLEGKLRNALISNEISLFYQPQIDIVTKKIVSAEALLRWFQPELGIISPAEFIPIAEETGMIIELGEWVLNQACKQNKTWQNAGLNRIRIAVNLSSIQFMQEDLVTRVSTALESNELNPEYLELEITESIIMRNVNDTISTLASFKEMGIEISVDDFGTGYSSLNYLKRLPLDTLKIDRSFIKDIPDDEDDVTITSAIIAMAQNLGLSVVAEGVETDSQLAFLEQRGCEKAQGYFISRPLPAEEMTNILQIQK